jgi:dynactin complex subunit
MAIQIGKYKRPGIFIEEYDKSILASTSVSDGITNMVIGVSKKGPINTPIKITNIADSETIFGQLDRGLERKGSFFHRTITKMLETAPVYAINLLNTDDELDKIEYKSISASSLYSNDIKRVGPYRKFFDTTGFWKRDTESFLDLVQNNYSDYNQSAFSLTNLSDKYITVFIVKTSKTGFDRTLIEWYGSQEKLPTYVNANDYASDYMVLC